LQAFDIRDPATVEALANSIRTSVRIEVDPGPNGRRFETVYPVGTDGELPAELDGSLRRRFDDVISLISTSLLQSVRAGAIQLQNNHLLLCLSWTFARCPREVQDAMAAALDAIPSGVRRGLLAPPRSARVVVNGIGRVITNPEMLRSMIPKLCADIDHIDFLAALSSLLSRPEATPMVLLDADIETIATHAIRIFKELREVRNFGPRFKYSLMLVAGLLRVRKRDPWALCADRSELAQAMVEELSAILAQILSMPGAITNETQKLQIIRDLIPLLSGHGGSPDILTIIDTLSED
jgi:hypothetical protein